MPQHPAPFRADHVGSLLRPQRVHDARAAFAESRLDAEGLTAIEDEAILEVVRAQEAAGLRAATDGELRRGWWHFDFFDLLDGVDVVEGESGMAFQGAAPAPLAVQVRDRIGFPADHAMLRHFAFLRDHTAVVPKMCIPSPTVLHFRLAADAVDRGVHPDRDALFADLATTWRDAIRAFAAAGCRYLQLDDTAWAYLCSEVELQRAEERGIDTRGIADAYAELLNEALRDRPDDLTVTTHVCRGNFRSTWIASGGYEPVARQLLETCDYDGYFLEYDTDRAGGFEPLRFLPDGDKRVVLGLVTSKSGTLEDPAVIERRIEEATEHAPLAQLALSPQCGFASTEEGNVLTEDQQWAKLRGIVGIAERTWGSLG
ncbi:5-methyltetrahydropteroyltriglutamate--homocysteine S-methyltransferase [uncultured Amnibacterium sp.]|uniref:5-methyltetrahydropteroyltriglutamate-- homocysteine S-methyltransferase n=1 Tax=uncultured Amnibacterium sp. TaxID=1631851 RepID=UPI0035CB9FB6